MKKILGHALAAMALLGPMPHAFAGDYTGTFRPYFYSDNLYIEEVSVQKSSVPACVKRNLLKLPADPASPAFKNEYAMLLAAWYTGRTLYISGSGNCTSEGDELVFVITPQ